jgi:hypothetical protein
MPRRHRIAAHLNGKLMLMHALLVDGVVKLSTGKKEHVLVKPA